MHPAVITRANECLPVQMTAAQFARCFQITERAARKAFETAAAGNTWRDYHLPVIALPGNQGGAGGKVWALAVDRCEPALKAKLGAVEGPFEAPVKRAFKGEVAAWQWDEQADRLRIIAPILDTSKRTAERAAAYRAVAAQMHLVRGVQTRIAENTLRDWVRVAETEGAASLLPAARSDKGVARVLITRIWDKAIGLEDAAKARIAETLNRQASGYVVNSNTSHRKLARLCQARLMVLSAEAGCDLPPDQLRLICELNLKWAKRFDKMRPVFQNLHDNKAFSDQHSPRITRQMERVPMDVIMGDVHHVDMWIAPLSDPMTVKLIAWMDASSGYLWATPVLVNNRQGITQEDVAKSLADVCFCQWAGMPTTFVLDNGSEYKGLVGAVGRLAYMVDGDPAFRAIKCRPYSPESKGRLEGCFNIFKGIIKGLPGYIGGDRMKKPTQSKGKPVAPYPHGPVRLIEDIHRAVETYNGTPQEGMLGGLSPRATFQRKADESGFAPRHPDPEMFDFVFSREKKRSVRNGRIVIGRRHYYGDVLGELIGAKELCVKEALRDPTGPVRIRHGGTIHTLSAESYSHTDGEGARRQAELAKGVTATIRSLLSLADTSVSEFDDMHALADKGPIETAPPEKWSMGARVIDKTAPRNPDDAAAAELADLLARKSFITPEMRENQRRARLAGRDG